MVMLLVASSCNEDEVIPKKSEEELAQLTTEKVNANQVVIEDAFVETSNKVTKAAIENALKTSSTKQAFIENMNALVEEVFENEIKSNSEQMASDVYIKLDGLDGEAIKTTVSEFILDPTSEDPLLGYANRIKSLLDAQAATGRSMLTLIEKYVDEEASEAAPAEQVTLNFAKIKIMYDLQTHVIRSGSNGVTAETDSEMDGILAQQGVPPVAIGLLLPAVQKFQNCCAGETSSSPYFNWLYANVNPEINGGLNRDIIRRYNAAGFMGALQMLLSDDYRNDNQDLASMLLLRARYQASLMFIWSDIWEKSKLANVMQTRVKSNESLLDSAFRQTAKILTRAAIIQARAESADKAAFIATMNEMVEGVFDREVQEQAQQYKGGVVIATGDLNGDGTSSHLAELMIANHSDPFNAYADLIQASIDNRLKQEGNTFGDLNLSFAIVNKVTDNGVDKDVYMSASPKAVSGARAIKDAVLLGRKGPVNTDEAIETLRVQHDIPKPLMALLLPAIQKVREYDGTAEKADTPYLKWLDSLDPIMPGDVNHDVVTKYDAAGYLGALHLFVLDKYRGDDQDYASLLLLKARYQATMVMIFNDLWVE